MISKIESLMPQYTRTCSKGCSHVCICTCICRKLMNYPYNCINHVGTIAAIKRNNQIHIYVAKYIHCYQELLKS